MMQNRVWEQIDWAQRRRTLTYQVGGEQRQSVSNFFFGRLADSAVVHIFSEEWRTPWCGSGNTHNVNMRNRKRIVKVEGEITCKKCIAIRSASDNAPTNR